MRAFEDSWLLTPNEDLDRLAAHHGVDLHTLHFYDGGDYNARIIRGKEIRVCDGIPPPGYVHGTQAELEQIDALLDSEQGRIAIALGGDEPVPPPGVHDTAARLQVNRVGEERYALMQRYERGLKRVQADYAAASQAARADPTRSGPGWVTAPTPPSDGQVDGQTDGQAPVAGTRVFSEAAYSEWYTSEANVRREDGSINLSALFFGAVYGTAQTDERGRVYFSTDHEDPQARRYAWSGDRMQLEGYRLIDLTAAPKLYEPAAVYFDPAVGFVTHQSNIKKKTNWLKTAATIVVVAVVSYVTAGAASTWASGYLGSTLAASAVGGAAGGAASAAVSGAINGNLNLGDIVQGAVIGAVSAGLSKYASVNYADAFTGADLVAVGVARGTVSTLTGGNFGVGFVEGSAGAAGVKAGDWVARCIGGAGGELLGRVTSVAVRSVATGGEIGQALLTEVAEFGADNTGLTGTVNRWAGGAAPAVPPTVVVSAETEASWQPPSTAGEREHGPWLQEDWGQDAGMSDVTGARLPPGTIQLAAASSVYADTMTDVGGGYGPSPEADAGPSDQTRDGKADRDASSRPSAGTAGPVPVAGSATATGGTGEADGSGGSGGPGMNGGPALADDAMPGATVPDTGDSNDPAPDGHRDPQAPLGGNGRTGSTSRGRSERSGRREDEGYGSDGNVVGDRPASDGVEANRAPTGQPYFLTEGQSPPAGSAAGNEIAWVTDPTSSPSNPARLETTDAGAVGSDAASSPGARGDLSARQDDARQRFYAGATQLREAAVDESSARTPEERAEARQRREEGTRMVEQVLEEVKQDPELNQSMLEKGAAGLAPGGLRATTRGGASRELTQQLSQASPDDPAQRAVNATATGEALNQLLHGSTAGVDYTIGALALTQEPQTVGQRLLESSGTQTVSPGGTVVNAWQAGEVATTGADSFDAAYGAGGNGPRAAAVSGSRGGRQGGGDANGGAGASREGLGDSGVSEGRAGAPTDKPVADGRAEDAASIRASGTEDAAGVDANPRKSAGQLALETSGRPVDDILAPGGESVGWNNRGASSQVRTVTQEDFDTIKSRLLEISTPDTSYKNGQWHVLTDGSGRFGLRVSDKHGLTIDVDVTGYPRGYKIHSK